MERKGGDGKETSLVNFSAHLKCNKLVEKENGGNDEEKKGHGFREGRGKRGK